jgi:uncharacterized protein (TIGR04255 family)
MPRTYRKNFLAKVMARIDFEPVLSIGKDPPSSFQQKIRDGFPRTQQGIAFVQLDSAEQPDAAPIPLTLWRFLNYDSNEAVNLGANFVSYEVDKYSSFEKFYEVFIKILNVTLELYAPLVINRFGLRYVNSISIEHGNAFEWDNLLKPFLIANITDGIGIDRSKVSRRMTNAHWNEEDFRVQLNCGYFNDEWPSAIAKREFVIDIDCVSVSATQDQIPQLIKSLNTHAERIFESCIEDGLRELMDNE